MPNVFSALYGQFHSLPLPMQILLVVVIIGVCFGIWMTRQY